MVVRVETLVNTFLSRHSLKDDDERYVFLFSNAACVYAASGHLFMLFFHLAVSILPLFLVYLCALLTDLLLFRLISKGFYAVSGIMLSMLIALNTFLSAIGTGVDKLYILYLFVALVMQLTNPYARASVRFLVGVFLWACMLALLFIPNLTTPIWDLGSASIIIMVFNINLTVVAIAIQLTLGNVIRSMILKLKSIELEELKNESNTDALTGLFNRRYADTFFENLSSSHVEWDWCVAMLDIDDFKLVNDNYGHQVGDGVLIAIGNMIKTSLRKTDLVFRWGGEEFLILLKDIDVSDAFDILNKMRSNIALENLETHGVKLNVTVTIGVCPLDIHHVKQSINLCDTLMYKGKALGKNMVSM